MQNWQNQIIRNQQINRWGLGQGREWQHLRPRMRGWQWRLSAIALFLLLVTACNPKRDNSSSLESPESPQSSEEDVTTQTSSDPEPTVTVPPTPVPDEIVADASAAPSDPQPKENAEPLESLPVVPTTPLDPPPINTATLPDPKILDDSPPLARGNFASAEHDTKGSFTIVDDEGTAIIQFHENFQTASSSDLFVVLHVAENVWATTAPPDYRLKDDDYVAIAPLKSSQGTQAYSIPAAVILENYSSLAIWSRRLNTTFGAAKLELLIN